jgi:hypothetical protein
MRVDVEHPRNVVCNLQPFAGSDHWNQTDGSCAANPHVSMPRPRAHARRERGMPHQQRTDQRAAHGVGRRPVGGMIVGKPPAPGRQQPRREIASVSSHDFDADRLYFEVRIADQERGEGRRLVHRPLAAMRLVHRPREGAHRVGADVVEAQVDVASEIAACVELAGWTPQPGDPAARPRRDQCDSGVDSTSSIVGSRYSHWIIAIRNLGANCRPAASTTTRLLCARSPWTRLKFVM